MIATLTNTIGKQANIRDQFRESGSPWWCWRGASASRIRPSQLVLATRRSPVFAENFSHSIRLILHLAYRNTCLNVHAYMYLYRGLLSTVHTASHAYELLY